MFLLKSKIMPELPEVETTRLGLTPHIVGKQITKLTIRQRQLRQMIPTNLEQLLQNQHIKAIERRAKYLILVLEHGFLIIHLGMTGHLRVLQDFIPADKHDHVDFELNGKMVLRYNDPRRFGSIIYRESIEDFNIFKQLGVEPLNPFFSGEKLYQLCQKRQVAIKTMIMNQALIVGVGNIYASEALFMAKIHPLTPAKNLSLKQCHSLCLHIKDVLIKAIAQGGTTLQDYINADGKPGYFKQSLQVYQRENKPCFICQTTIKKLIIGQRSTFFCPHCQFLRESSC
jgi:formamidopyrimidine-DNA glycosylase